MFGFILTRHVNSPITNKYWNHSYRTIRKHYPKNIIMIIDDNSIKEEVVIDNDIVLENCFIVSSEFKGAGEILPYYYFLKYKLFDKAIILHDSVFFNSFVDFENATEDVLFLWHFTQHEWDNVDDEVGLLDKLENKNEMIDFYFQKHLWFGCFGGQCIITYDFLKEIEDYYKFSNIVPYVTDRVKRYAVERILGCIFTMKKRNLLQKPSLFGTIYNYMPWGYTFSMYEKDLYSHLPIVKVWSER